ncbi:MAG: hypothetical protein IAE90_02480 [Ignavibacteria bacterium]|nr:hypothetical protein [Ignavibacteria bacterium]
MKYILAFLLVCLISGCGEDTINNNGSSGAGDFDIYINRFTSSPLRFSSYVIKADGSGFSVFNDTLGVFSRPGGSKILMMTIDSFFSYRVYSAYKDGSGLTKIPLGSYRPVYFDISPTGDKILFTTDDGNYLCIINSDGTGLVQLSDGIRGTENIPKFSPNGNLIAFYEAPASLQTTLNMISLSGSYKKKLKDSIYYSTVWNLDWSADGTKIVFPNNMNNSGEDRICTIDTSGNNFTVLTEGINPACSPSGNKISYFVNVNQGIFDLFMMNSDGTSISNISSSPVVYEGSQAWSGDGLRLLYSGQPGTGAPYYSIYNVQTGNSAFLRDSVYGAYWK